MGDSEAPISSGPWLSRPMGGRLVPGGVGATFKIWAPSARKVELLFDYELHRGDQWEPRVERALDRLPGGVWTTFVEHLVAGDRYMFRITGPEDGTTRIKRDPYALDLSDQPGWPHCQGLLYDPESFPWHDQDFVPPSFSELSLYQLHVGTWYIPEGASRGTFLDVMSRIPYLQALGVRAVQLLPVVEFPGFFSLGYNGTDYFSPETDYGIHDSDPRLREYLITANSLLKQARPGARAYQLTDLSGTASQLRVLIDLLHVHNLSVILDVVYNHAGGDFDAASIYYLDGQAEGDHNRSLYFTDQGWAGGLVFAYWNADVRQFLIDNALYFLKDCHADGLRYDEVSVIRREGGDSGRRFCQDITDTCHFARPSAIHIAEHWPPSQEIVAPTGLGGAGFDACLNDGLREAIRGAVAQASFGSNSQVDMNRIGRELSVPALTEPSRAVQMCENHDIVKRGEGQRMAQLADSSDSRSWYARSRSRVALGLIATAPGIPHLFMGQEILEDKQWSDDPNSGLGIGWQALEVDARMATFLRFSQDIMALRHQRPALTSWGLNVFHVHNDNRIVAFHRWVPGSGQDVVVVASLNESTFWDYQLGFPVEGEWREVFNSDAYEHDPDHVALGNAGSAQAWGPPRHGLPSSAALVIPANSLLVFARSSPPPGAHHFVV